MSLRSVCVCFIMHKTCNPVDLILRKLTQRVPLVEQELLLTVPKNLSSRPVFNLARSLVFCAVLKQSLFAFLYLFLLPLYRLVLRFIAFYYPFCIFKLSFHVFSRIPYQRKQTKTRPILLLTAYLS